MKKEPIDSKIDYYRDNALTGRGEDEFQHAHYVSVLKDILLKSQTPINVGLYGKWGVGKSSIVHMLREEIEKDDMLKDFKYVEVDAWGISGKSLQQGILEEINEQLGQPYPPEKLEDRLYNVHHVETVRIEKFTKLWIPIIGPILVAGIIISIAAPEHILSALTITGLAAIATIFTTLLKFFSSTSKKIIPRAISTFQFNKIYDGIIKKQEKKLVIVIDNLDRCDDTVAIDLLGIIQTFMVKRKCINILACDDEAIVKHLNKIKNYENRDGNEFLSKFFQITIRIPPFIGENLSTYAEKLIKKRSVQFSPFVKPILISGAIENPRKINQFLNIAVALYRLAEFKEDAGRLPKGSITKNTNFLMKMIVIRHEWPEFYKALENNPSLLTDMLNDDAKQFKYFRSTLKFNEEQSRRLEKFLNATKTSYAKDITPFLRLNQESYAAESSIGEFEDAIITLDPKAKNIFKHLPDEKQEPFLNKIHDIMEHCKSEPEKLTLVNCALSLIDILPHISNSELQAIALGTLGQYMSSELLEHLDKFDAEQLDLFPILEDMSKEGSERFSKLIYDELVFDAFNEELNEDLVEKFFKNGNIISSQILDRVDGELANKIFDKSYSNLEFIKKCIQINPWSENNISKPSKIVDRIIKNIDFSETEENIIFTKLYENIKDIITDEEVIRFYEQMHAIIIKHNESSNPLPERLSDHLINYPIESFDIGSDKKQRIFAALCDSIQNNDLTQNEEILKLIIPLYQKMRRLPDPDILSGPFIEKAFSHHIKRTDAHMLTNLITQSTYDEFLRMDQMVTTILDKYVELDSNIPEIIRFLLKIKSYTTELIISSAFEIMLSIKEEAKFSTLLAVAKEDDTRFNSSIVRKICQACLNEAQDETNPVRHSLYQHAIQLHPTPFEKTMISDYGTELIKSEDDSIQDQGFSLLTEFNSNLENTVEPAGVTTAITITHKLIQENSTRVAQCLDFINKFSDHFSIVQTGHLIDLLKTGLDSSSSETIANFIIEYVQQFPSEIFNGVLDDLINFAANTTYTNAKEQCKQIFILNKNNIFGKHDQIKEIFGKDIFD